MIIFDDVRTQEMMYLPSERHEDEADGAGDRSNDGEGDSSTDGEAGEEEKSGEVYI